MIQELDKKDLHCLIYSKHKIENGSHFICSLNLNNLKSTVFISCKMTNIVSGSQEFVNSLIGNTNGNINAKLITFYKTLSGLGLPLLTPGSGQCPLWLSCSCLLQPLRYVCHSPSGSLLLLLIELDEQPHFWFVFS